MRFFGKCFLMIFVKQCLLDGKLVVKSIDLKGILGEGRHPTTFCWCVPFGEKTLGRGTPWKVQGLEPKKWRFGSDDFPFRNWVIFKVPAVHFPGVSSSPMHARCGPLQTFFLKRLDTLDACSYDTW